MTYFDLLVHVFSEEIWNYRKFPISTCGGDSCSWDNGIIISSTGRYLFFVAYRTNDPFVRFEASRSPNSGRPVFSIDNPLSEENEILEFA